MSSFVANHLSYMGLVSILLVSQLDILHVSFLHGVIFVYHKVNLIFFNESQLHVPKFTLHK